MSTCACTAPDHFAQEPDEDSEVVGSAQDVEGQEIVPAPPNPELNASATGVVVKEPPSVRKGYTPTFYAPRGQTSWVRCL